MTKKEARKVFKEMRLSLTVGDRNRFDDLILIHFQQLQLPDLFYVHTYLAMKEQREIETDHLLHYLEFRNPELKIVIPRMDHTTSELLHIEYDELVDVMKNEWGIHEPVNGNLVDEQLIDLVFVPLLAFDEDGYRVGYGKGFYDKFLAKCRPDVLKVGLSYFEPIPRISDRAQFDIPLNYCVTPQRVYEFG
ncbi:5-formyltetrahydrofolate cyclo-ligase [Lacibacter cauensis]|uniref:5-formyltetrahydrofolate cyclo-ligase n=1 Tax=Lacibacter cauensis TaxID=510947 RepID=A0A562SV50_9BACT|nr:5-formyltetrahydrofolate cyclo-ligase [Lacibacter cauensis]TWI85197.1 5-formyltetrahydrofolate cyclo-ligase [Lacibacter cauensis]